MNGLMVLSYALSDAGADDGGFAVVPGSHKANLPVPKRFISLEETGPWVVRVPVQAGDAILFSEACTHGTWPWRAKHERRSLLYKYAPGHTAWAAPYPVARRRAADRLPRAAAADSRAAVRRARARRVRRRLPQRRAVTLARSTRADVTRAETSCAASAHGPTRISTSPGSNTGSRSTPKNRSSAAGSRNRAMPVSPGSSAIFVTPLSSSVGRATLATRSRTNRNTVSSAARAPSFVTSTDTSIASPSRRALRADAQIRVDEPAVREAEAERKERRVRRVEIFAREVVLRILRPAGIALTVEQRNLPERARPRDRRSARRRHAARQHVGDRVTRLGAGEPRDEQRVGPLREPRNDQRPAAEQHDDDRYFVRARALEHRLGERALLAGQLGVGAATPLRRSSRPPRRGTARRRPSRSHTSSTAAAMPERSAPAIVTPSACTTCAFGSASRSPASTRDARLFVARRGPRAAHLAPRVGQRPDHADAAQRLRRSGNVSPAFFASTSDFAPTSRASRRRAAIVSAVSAIVPRR